VKKAGDLLNVYFDDIQRAEGEQYSNFQNSWENIAGKKIGINSKIKDVVDGNLIIEIDHPGWKQLIMMKEKGIIRAINKDFPQLHIKKIKFYFKNNSVKVVKPLEKRENVEINPTEDRVIDKDFSELLKKMSKRSEE